MTEDISSLQIRILYDSVSQAERRLRELEATGRRNAASMREHGKAGSSLMGTIGKLALSYITLRGAVSAFQAVIRKTAEFQQLNAQLVTATGSADKARFAFGALKDFAAQTPFDLQQVTGAFISLVNRGLTPSEKALRSYGDTASSMGFSLADMVLAVSNATSGEYENLKKFGIRAAKEGDNIKFTFRGITTEVKNSAKEIEGYFIAMGEKNFSGGMARQMDTLTGAFSNFGDSWEVLLNSIGEKGLGDFVENTVRQATDAISDFTRYIESGQFAIAMAALEVRVQGQGVQWQVLGQTIAGAFSNATRLMEAFVDDAQTDANEWDTYWHDVFTNFPANVNFMLKLSGVYLEGFVRKAAAAAQTITGAFKVDKGTMTPFNQFLGDMASKGGLMSAQVQANWDAMKAANALAKSNADMAAGPGDWNLAGKPGASIEDETQANIDALIRERDAIAASTEAYNDRAATMLDLSEGGALFVGPPGTEAGTGVLPPLGAINPTDRLAQFAIGGSDSATSAGAASGATKKVASAEFEKEMLKSIYEAEARNELEALAQQEQKIRDSYEQRMRDILELQGLTESEKLALMKKAEMEYTQAQIDFQRKRQEAQLTLSADFFGNLSAMAGAFGSRGSKIAKAAAIVQTTISTYEGATKAYSSLASIPYIGPALGAAAAGAAIAAGLANVQRIKAQDDSGGYAGAYATGGIVGGRSFTGDRLTANVNSGEMILNGEQQKRLFDMANKGGVSSRPVEVYVQNLPGQVAEVETSANGDVVKIAVKQAVDTLINEVNSGGGRFVPALAKRFNLKRQTA